MTPRLKYFILSFTFYLFLSSFIDLENQLHSQSINWPCDIAFLVPLGQPVNGPELPPYKIYSSDGRSVFELSKLFDNQNIDGNIGIQINDNTDAFIQMDFGTDVYIHNIKFFYPLGINNVQDFWIIYSSNISGDMSIDALMANNQNNFTHIASQYDSGSNFPAEHVARYLTIVKRNGPLTFSGIKIDGKKEICGNGNDDDCDGKIDCEDEDCQVNKNDYTIKVIKHPSCPNCCDGIINLTFSSIKDLEYSFDGGITWHKELVIDNLCKAEINFIIRIKNGCNEINEKINLSPPLGNPTSPCDNGDFEKGTFENFNGKWGSREYRGGNENINWTSPGLDNKFFNIISQDGNVKPYSGSYCAKIGSLNIGGVNASNLSYKFTPDGASKKICFAYFLKMEIHDKPGDGDRNVAYFKYYIKEPNSQSILVTNEIIASVNSDASFFNQWRCVCLDIKDEFLNKELEINFEMVACDEGGHNGVAYIDGFCEDQSFFNPIACFDFLDCEYDAAADGRLYVQDCSSKNNDFKFTVCVINNEGIELECKETKRDFFEIKELFQYKIDCNNKVKVKLEVWNTCGGYDSKTEIHSIKCDKIPLDFNTIACFSSINSEETFEFDIGLECHNCTYLWTSNGNNVAQIINPSSKIPSFKLKAPYEYRVDLKVTQDDGCIVKRTFIINAIAVWLYYNQDQTECYINTCEQELFLGFTIVSENNKVQLGQHQTIFHESSGHQYDILVTEVNKQYKREYSGNTKVSLNDFNTFSWNPNIYGLYKYTPTCIKKFEVDKKCYTGDIPQVAAPNVVSPNAIEPKNRVFCITALSGMNPCTFNSKQIKLRIYARWGSAFEWTYNVPECDYIIPAEEFVCWDLKLEGLFGIKYWAPSGEYTWVLELDNCSNSKRFSGEFIILY